jgi:hypothetical protein
VSLAPTLLWPPHSRLEPPTPPPSGAIKYWIDVSNYQGALTPEWFAHYTDLGFGGLIVQAVRSATGEMLTQQQLEAALEAGWDIAGYLWCWARQQNNMASVHERLSYFDGFSLDFLAVDIEDMATTLRDVEATLDAADDYQQDLAWIYTAKRIFDHLGWSDNHFWANRKLWFAGYDGLPDVNVGFRPFGGWTQAEMKQWTDTPVDQNVRR